MFFTNNRSYPRYIADILIQLYNDYSKGDADYSVTELIGSPLERVLRKRHEAELEIDVDSLYFMFIGSIGHAIAEKAKMDYIIATEHRMYVKHDGVMVSGQLDTIYEYSNRVRIDDVKLCSKSDLHKPVRRSYVRQANLYRFFWNITKNQLADELGILAFFRNATMFEQKCARLPINVFTLDQCSEFLSKQIALHKLVDWDATSKVPECTPADRWATEETWCVKKNKNKTTKALPRTIVKSKAEALNILDSKVGDYPDAIVEHRPATNAKCESACDVAKFCWYKQDLDAGYITDSYNCKGDETPKRVKIGAE